jgi:chromosome segregation ATPase
LRDIRNNNYGHLNLLEIEDAQYNSVLARLKHIIDNFTQNAPHYQQDLRDRIKQIESIQALSSISPADMSNLKEIILELISKNRDMFSQIGQVNKDIDAFIATSKEFQKGHSDKIDEIRQLSLELKKWSESIKNQNKSQKEMNKIAETVSAHLSLKLNLEYTLKQHSECINSHTDAKTKEVIDHVDQLKDHVDQQFESLNKKIKDGLKLEHSKCKFNFLDI